MMITDLTSPNTESNRFNSSPVIPKGRLSIKILTRSISPEIKIVSGFAFVFFWRYFWLGASKRRVLT
jgi:hypothetical protein